MDVGTADGLLTGAADFDPTSAWGDGDGVTAAVPDGADFDPTSLDSTWGGGGGDDATAAIPTSVWGDGDEVTAAILEAAPTRKREHVAAARADHTDDGATATAVSAAGIGRADFDATSVWVDGDEVTATIPVFGAAAPAGATQPPSPANTSVDVGAVVTSSGTVARKRTRRSKHSHVVRDERKRQRRAVLLSTTQGDTGAGTWPAQPAAH